MITSNKKARHAAPSSKMSSFKKFTVVAVVGLAAAVSIMSAASDGKTAYINDNGKEYMVAADSTDIDTVLSEAGITLCMGDKTYVTEQSGNSVSIKIKRAFPVTVSAYGETKVIRLTEGTVSDALTAAGFKPLATDFVTPAPETKLTDKTKISVVKGVKVYLERSGEKELVYVPDGTVKDALKFAGCELCSEGNDGIKQNDRVESGMTMRVDNVFCRTTFVSEEIAPKTVNQSSCALAEGETLVQQEGKPGKMELAYKEKYVNGELVEKKLDKKTVKAAPVDRIVLVGGKAEDIAENTLHTDVSEEEEAEDVEQDKHDEADDKAAEQNTEEKTTDNTNSDDGKITYNSVITGVCTAYTEANGITATGTAPRVGTVAVNPEVIPYGTRLYIESADGSFVYGYAVAEDTGGACMAGDIVVDLYMDTEAECCDFGRRELNIYVLD